MAWPYNPSSRVYEAGCLLASTGNVTIVNRNTDPDRHYIKAFVNSSDGKSKYFVLVRSLYPFFNRYNGSNNYSAKKLMHCICSCPDRRDGYCKHCAAVIEELKNMKEFGNNLQKINTKSKWIQSAYSSSVNTKEIISTNTDEKKWLRNFELIENAMNALGVKGCAQFLKNCVLKHDSPSREIVSVLFGGDEARSECYQSMHTTRLVDTWARIDNSTYEYIEFTILYLIYELKIEVIEKELCIAGKSDLQ